MINRYRAETELENNAQKEGTDPNFISKGNEFNHRRCSMKERWRYASYGKMLDISSIPFLENLPRYHTREINMKF